MKNDIEIKAAAAITGETKKVTIRVNNLRWWHRLKLVPIARTYYVRPLSMGSLMRVSKLLLEIGYDIDAADPWNEGLKAAHQAHKMAFVCAIALSNGRENPSRKMVNWLLNNLTPKELLGVLGVVVRQMDMKSFISSIISVRGMSLLNQGSQIAPGDLLEE